MSFRKILCININGKRWVVGYGYPGGQKVRGKLRVHDGICNWEKRKIIIQAEKRGRFRSLAETIFHEVAHARFPDMQEHAIEELSSLAGKIFTKMQKHEKQKE
jgi:hypothetical protein